MKHTKKRKLHTLLGLAGLLLVFSLFVTQLDPHNLPLPALIVPSVLAGMIVFMAIRLVQAFFWPLVRYSYTNHGRFVCGYIITSSLSSTIVMA